MKEVKGKYNTALIYNDNVESSAYDQIKTLCDQEFTKDSSIRIMPDCHSGAGCTIGTTMTIADKIVPNLVGVDIGCGVLTVKLGKTDVDLQKLDSVIHAHVPHGFDIHERRKIKFDEMQELRCYRELKNSKRFELSISTLGGGNHFIELNRDDDGNRYLVIHSGSRNLGLQVADHYQKLAISLCSGKEEFFEKKEHLIEEYKRQGKRDEIHNALKKLEKQYKAQKPSLPEALCYLSGKYKDDYLHDMRICQDYAVLNRKTMADIILQKMKIDAAKVSSFETIHNYIDFKRSILRKGAVSAEAGEPLIIPINMRDGSLICEGKGNPDWNYSAPHGAGRLMSRSKAKEMLSLDDFKTTMKDIYSTSVGEATLDEAPMAYKDMREIVDYIGDTAEIKNIIRPLYNFKAVD